MILILGAGGGLKEMLLATHIGDSIAHWAAHWSISPLVLGWAVAALIRIAIGSATVVTVTAAGIVAPIAAATARRQSRTARARGQFGRPDTLAYQRFRLLALQRVFPALRQRYVEDVDLAGLVSIDRRARRDPASQRFHRLNKAFFMNYEHLFKTLASCTIRMALVSPKGGFGRSLLVQCRAIKSLEIAALCDIDIEGTLATLASLGFSADATVVCNNADDVRNARAAGRIALFGDHLLLNTVELDIVVETTGHPEVSVQIAENALKRGVHVTMATKETDSVVGPYLNRLAIENKVTYTTPDGDQPSNLIGLVTWARVLGFEVIAAGKSSEYDFIYDPAAHTIDYLDQRHEVSLDACWTLGDDIAATVKARSQALSMLPQSATPDYCEMNVVANSIGFAPAADALNYPLARISELADIFVPKEDGGILERTGVVDVFNCLRRPDDVSFGGGMFVIVRCKDDETWQLLKQKGHLVGKNGRYACIYLPTPDGSRNADEPLFRRTARPADGQRSAVAVCAHGGARQARLQGGEVFAMGGHHHTIDGATPLLMETSKAEEHGAAPFYFAANKRFIADVKAGDLVPLASLDLQGSALYAAWQRNPSH
ncbi:Homoserine dehydrogenase [Candidatus Burkholderia humilis]|nr:Homoserine dehydrogenase [Candidatus Burkholderia humilis]